MSDVSKLNFNNTIYDIKDATARTEIENLKTIGRFLAVLDCSNGTVSSQPSGAVGDTYNYKVGDYYRVGAAGNYGPKGTATYIIDDTSGSSNFEQGETSYGIGDVIFCSNLTSTTSTWVKQGSSGGGTVQDVQVDSTSVLSGGIANITLGDFGVTATSTDLNYTSGTTSNIQTQINSKQDAIENLNYVALSTLQPTLVSGTNIKTINNQSVLGSGNLTIDGGVTGVKGNAESSYRTGQVNLTVANLGVTATTTELNVLDGITATTTELNYTDGVTSNIQTQLNSKEPADATILKQANVVNNVTSTSTNLPLSAAQGKALNDRINNISNIGKFLALWNLGTGLPMSNPPGELPYIYHTGDYYRIGQLAEEPTPTENYRHDIQIINTGGPAFNIQTTIINNYETAYQDATSFAQYLVENGYTHYQNKISATGTYESFADIDGLFAIDANMIALTSSSMPGGMCGHFVTTIPTITFTDEVTPANTNVSNEVTSLIPNGSSYTGAASTTTSTETYTLNDIFYYDGSEWKLQKSGGGGTVLDVQINGTSILSSGIANITESNLPNLSASKITSGTFTDARIPSLSASKITSGTFADARIASASTWNAKQDALPTVVNDRYLHTNSSTGALEWSEVSSGAAWGSITGTLSNQTDLQSALNTKLDTSNTTSETTTTVTLSKDGENGFFVDSGADSDNGSGCCIENNRTVLGTSKTTDTDTIISEIGTNDAGVVSLQTEHETSSSDIITQMELSDSGILLRSEEVNSGNYTQLLFDNEDTLFTAHNDKSKIEFSARDLAEESESLIELHPTHIGIQSVGEGISGQGNIIVNGVIGGVNNLELTGNKVTSITSSSTNIQYPSAKAVYDNVSIKANSSDVYTKTETDTQIANHHDSTKEDTTNKSTTITATSTDTQYPSAKAVYDNLSNVISVAEGKCKSYVINAKSDITGTESASGDFTDVTAITGVTLANLKLGDIILIKEIDVPDYWVSQITPSYSLNRMETSKIDLTNYVTKNNPSTTGLLTHEANGAGSQAQALKIRSNNGYLTMYGDASSNAHLGGVGVAFDTTLFINNGITFPSYGQTLNFNGATMTGIAQVNANIGATNKVETGCDFNGYPAVQAQNFVVKNKNVTGGLNDNWSYQAYQYNTSTEVYDRNFGVKADGTVISKGNALSSVSVANTGTATDEVKYITVDGTEKKIADATWGSITGTLANQTDLNTALDNKANKPITRSNISVSGTPTALSEYCAWDTQHLYGYYLDVTVSGITANSNVENIVMTDVLSGSVANILTTGADYIRFYTKTDTALSGLILTLLTSEVS